MNAFGISLSRSYRFFLIPVVIFMLSGCGSTFAIPENGVNRVRLSGLSKSDIATEVKKFFFAEYLEISGKAPRKVAILVDSLESPLSIIMNPAKYLPGQTGYETPSEIMNRYNSMRLYAVHTASGKQLGFALLPLGKSLRSVRVHETRHWLEISP